MGDGSCRQLMHTRLVISSSGKARVGRFRWQKAQHEYQTTVSALKARVHAIARKCTLG